MKLYVYVLEASGLAPCESQTRSASLYAKIRIGKRSARSKCVDWGKEKDPCWNQEFVFRIDEDEAQSDCVQVSVFCQFEAAGKELIGRCKIPVVNLIHEKNNSVGPAWFSLQPKHNASKSKSNNHGKILLTMSLVGSSKLVEPNNQQVNEKIEPFGKDSVEKSTDSGQLSVDSLSRDSTEESIDSVSKNRLSNGSDFPFEEAMEIMKSRDKSESHENLQGGIVLQKSYATNPKELNEKIFRPNSQFIKDLLNIQGTTDYEEGPWTWSTMDPPKLTRTVRYTKAASKLVKSVKGIEEQTYLKADGENFAVFVRVETPDVPYGDYFEVSLLYKISPGPESASQLIISYNIDFVKSTLMKSMIESQANQGLKENFEAFEQVLSRFVKPICVCSDKDQLLAPLRSIHQSDFGLAVKYFCNYTVVLTVVIGLYVFAHIMLSKRDRIKLGLEFNGLDLPDSFGELITSGVLFLLIERVVHMISHFTQARLQRGCRDNNETRENGEGWLLTVALIEGTGFPSINSSSLDPYVIFTCNGITKSSSVQLQTQDPQWNEIIEFDAMQEPPSVLDVEIFNFDGPFDSAISLGHAEINLIKHSTEELSDMWVPLEGKMSQESQSQLHLRVFLENTKGAQTVKEYLTKMEKQVGKKLNIQSPHKNSTFQKLFELPSDEYLIKVYSCALKKKLPLQGKLYLSARVLAFYSNILGRKTKFFFTWNEVDEMQELPPSFSTFGRPALLIFLKPGRGLDARHGARCQDASGRLKFAFHTFASFDSAFRTIKALWRSKGKEDRSISEDEVESDEKSNSLTDTESISSSITNSNSIFNLDNVNLAKTSSVELPIHVDSLMEIFNGGDIETKIMGKVGCLDYSVTQWEAVKLKPGFLERQVSYKFNKYMSIFGSEVVSTQTKYPSGFGNGNWTVDDVMTLHSVPFADHFRIHLRYEMWCVQSDLAPISKCDVFVGVEWLKKTQFKKRIARNICERLTQRSKEIFELAETELACLNQDY